MLCRACFGLCISFRRAAVGANVLPRNPLWTHPIVQINQLIPINSKGQCQRRCFWPKPTNVFIQKDFYVVLRNAQLLCGISRIGWGWGNMGRRQRAKQSCNRFWLLTFGPSLDFDKVAIVFPRLKRSRVI